MAVGHCKDLLRLVNCYVDFLQKDCEQNVSGETQISSLYISFDFFPPPSVTSCNFSIFLSYKSQLSSSVCTEEDTAGTWCFSVISLGTVTLQADTLPEGCFRAASCSFVVN